MNDFTQVILILGVVIGAAALIMIAFELRQLRNSISSGVYESKEYSLRDTEGDTHHGMMKSVAGFAIYVSRRGTWELAADLSNPGYKPSPPSLAGRYEGQAIKSESHVTGGA